eukprot:s172_g13.t2
MTELEEIRQRRAAAWEQAQQAREREGSTASNDAPVGEAAPAGPTASAAPADVSAERCCRICFDSSESKEGANGSSEPGGETGKLFSPCQCTGSMRFVHVSCLNDWRSASCNDRSYYRCDACHYEYRLQRLWVADVLISPGFHLALAISCFSFSALMVGILGRLLVPWVVDLCMDHLHLAPNVRFLFSDKDALANGNPACWQQGYTFQVCCSRGRPGNPICWDDLHTYESCCLGVSQALRSLRGVAGRVGDRMGDKVGEDKVGDKVREAWGNAGGSWQIVLLVAYLPGRSRQLFFGPTSAPAISRHFPNASLQRGSAVLAMVQVEIWSLTLASVKAVGSIAVMAAGGFLMTRLGIITNDVRKGLGELSMNLLLPCLMFSQVIYCNSKEMGGNVCPNMAQVIMSSADLFLWPIVVVTSGYCLGFLAAKLLRVPENFRRAAAGSVAFGNSTGMPVVLLSTMAPSLVAEGVVKGDPLLFLPVYLVLSPLLQWTVGSYIFRGPKVTEKSDVENPAPAADAAGVASIPSIPEASIPEANVPPMDSTYSAKSVPVQVTRAATSQGVFREMELKQEGINGLRAFVQCSEKLLVLWSDQYFNRLWCAYELGCFLSRSKRVQVEIMPLKISAILLLGSMVWHVLMFSYYLIRDSLTDGTIFTQNSQRRPWSFIYISVATVGVAVVLLPIVNYLGMSFLDDTDLLPTQVQNFRIQESECFCCKNNHEDPQTGEKLMCDRELVYQSLAELYLGEGVEAVEGSELEKFNQLVRETLGPKVLRRLGVRGTYLPLRYMSFLVMTSNFPMLSELIWHFSQGPETPLVGMTYFIWCMHLILRWLQPLLAMLFSLELSTRLWKMKNVSKLPRILLSILLSPIQSLGAGCVFASMEFAVRFSGDSTWVPLVPFLLGLLLNFILRVPASREEVRYQTISFGIEPPLQVGPGLSAQGELEDVLTPEDVQLPCQRDRCGKRLKHILFMFLSPPVAATLLGILVAFIRPLQNQFVNLNDWTLPDQRALDWAYNAVRTLGQAAVPVNLLMLGSNLSKGADFSALPVGMAIGLTLTKMLLQPAVVAFFVFCVSRLIPGPVVTGKWLVAIVVSLTPTANNIMVQVEVGGQDKAAMTTLIFIQYLLSPILLTISLTATSALMQVDGFLPHGSLPDFHAQTRMRLRGDELRPPSCWPGQSSYRKVEPTVTLIGFLSRV